LVNNACVEVTATTTDPLVYTAGQSGMITWTFDDGTYTDTATQNVTVNAIPVPSNINVTPGTTTAYIAWDAIDDVTFNVQYRLVGSSTWLTETTLTNSITLNGLILLTNYEFQINSDCGSSQSAYSMIQSFMTTDITYVTPLVSFYPDDFYINSFELVDNTASSILLNTSNQNEDVMGYSNHTDDGLTIPDLKQGDAFDINIMLTNTHPWNKTSGHSVWIDFDQNGDFDGVGERVWGTTAGDDLFPHSANASITGTFTVPSSALIGNTRMRVASRTYYTPENPESMSFDANNGGEYEDYTVNITSNTLSTSNFNIEGFALYPNPANDSFTLKLPNATTKDITVKLIDLQGRIIQNKTIVKSQNSIVFNDLNQLNSGVYFVTISDNNRVLISKKLMKL